MIDYKMYNLNFSEKIRFLVIILIGTLFISELFYGTLFFALLTPLVYVLLLDKVAYFLNQKRLFTIREQFRDCLYSMSAAFSLGRHMRDALENAKVSMNDLYGSESIVYKELHYMIHCMDDAGTDEIVAWKDFARRCPIDDILEFTDVFEACRDSGGNIVNAMNKAAFLITEKMTIEKDINTQIMQKKYEGRIIGTMPILILFFLRIFSPDYVEILYSSFMGRIIMTIAITLIVIAYVSEERITSIDV